MAGARRHLDAGAAAGCNRPPVHRRFGRLAKRRGSRCLGACFCGEKGPRPAPSSRALWPLYAHICHRRGQTASADARQSAASCKPPKKKGQRASPEFHEANSPAARGPPSRVSQWRTLRQRNAAASQWHATTATLRSLVRFGRCRSGGKGEWARGAGGKRRWGGGRRG